MTNLAPHTESISPATVFRRRFFNHKPAVAGGLFLLLAVFLALFGALVAPDGSRNANQQDLRLIALSPGSRISQLIFVPNDYLPTVWYKRWFLGEEDPLERIPLAAWRLEGALLHYRIYDASEASWLVVSLETPRGSYRIKEQFYWLGTDVMGRDLLSRLLLGLRVSLGVGFIAVLISIGIGASLGAVAGYFKGRVDLWISWLINVIWSIPSLLLVIAFSLALGKGMWQVFLAVGLTMWVDVARIVRGQVLALREQEFVTAARAMGFSHFRIIFRHLLPNVVGPVIIMAASNFATAILVESGLSFLGLGVQPPTPSLGMMIKEHYPYIIMDAAYLALVPGVVILLLVLAFNLLGNGLSDTFDSKVKMS
ncbi:MAG: ABC transporter permease [Bacteroidia bacterium]